MEQTGINNAQIKTEKLNLEAKIITTNEEIRQMLENQYGMAKNTITTRFNLFNDIQYPFDEQSLPNNESELPMNNDNNFEVQNDQFLDYFTSNCHSGNSNTIQDETAVQEYSNDGIFSDNESYHRFRSTTNKLRERFPSRIQSYGEHTGSWRCENATDGKIILEKQTKISKSELKVMLGEEVKSVLYEFRKDATISRIDRYQKKILKAFKKFESSQSGEASQKKTTPVGTNNFYGTTETLSTTRSEVSSFKMPNFQNAKPTENPVTRSKITNVTFAERRQAKELRLLMSSDGFVVRHPNSLKRIPKPIKRFDEDDYKSPSNRRGLKRNADRNCSIRMICIPKQNSPGKFFSTPTNNEFLRMDTNEKLPPINKPVRKFNITYENHKKITHYPMMQIKEEENETMN